MKIPEYTRNKLVSTMSSANVGSDRSADILSDAHGRTGSTLANAYNRSADTALQVGRIESSNYLQAGQSVNNAIRTVLAAERKQQEYADQIEAETIAYEHSHNMDNIVRTATENAGLEYDGVYDSVKNQIDTSTKELAGSISNKRVRNLVQLKSLRTRESALDNVKTWQQAAQADGMRNNAEIITNTAIAKGGSAQNSTELAAELLAFENSIGGVLNVITKTPVKAMYIGKEKVVKAYETNRMVNDPVGMLQELVSEEYQMLLADSGIADVAGHVRKQKEVALEAANKAVERADDQLHIEMFVNGGKIEQSLARGGGNPYDYVKHIEGLRQLPGMEHHLTVAEMFYDSLIRGKGYNVETDSGKLATLKEDVARMTDKKKGGLVKKTTVKEALDLKRRAAESLSNGHMTLRDFDKTNTMISDALAERMESGRNIGRGSFTKGFDQLEEFIRKNKSSFRDSDATVNDLLDDYYDEYKRYKLDDMEKGSWSGSSEANHAAIAIAKKVISRKMVEINPEFLRIPDGGEGTMLVNGELVKFRRNGTEVEEVGD